jgi:hypothetical protein
MDKWYEFSAVRGNRVGVSEHAFFPLLLTRMVTQIVIPANKLMAFAKKCYAAGGPAGTVAASCRATWPAKSARLSS